MYVPVPVQVVTEKPIHLLQKEFLKKLIGYKIVGRTVKVRDQLHPVHSLDEIIKQSKLNHLKDSPVPHKLLCRIKYY